MILIDVCTKPSIVKSQPEPPPHPDLGCDIHGASKNWFWLSNMKIHSGLKNLNNMESNFNSIKEKESNSLYCSNCVIKIELKKPNFLYVEIKFTWITVKILKIKEWKKSISRPTLVFGVHITFYGWKIKVWYYHGCLMGLC